MDVLKMFLAANSTITAIIEFAVITLFLCVLIFWSVMVVVLVH